MPKSKYTEKHTVSVEGIFNADDMSIEIEDVGVKELADILSKFNGCNIKFSVSLGNDLD